MNKAESKKRKLVFQALSSGEWRDCFDVADETGLTLARCGKLLGELHRENTLHRRASRRDNNAEYEYLLRADADAEGGDAHDGGET